MEFSLLGAPREKGDDVSSKSDGSAFGRRFLATNASQKWPRNDAIFLHAAFNFMILLEMCDLGIAIALVSSLCSRSATRRGDAKNFIPEVQNTTILKLYLLEVVT